MDSLLFSLQSVVPLFLLILVGYILRKKEIINDGFVGMGTKIVFNISLPILIFTQISAADLTTLFNPRLILYCLVFTSVEIVLLCLIIPRFVKSRASAGAMIQGIYRGNFAILGVALAVNMFGTEKGATTSLLLPFTIPLYNATAVAILTVFAPNEEDKQAFPIKKILKGIATNPLIIAIVIGLPFSLLKIQLPVLITKCLTPFSNLTTPLALICLGGQCTIDSIKSNMKLSVIAALLKEVVISSIGILGGILLGFRDGELGAIFILFMAPSAVASYVMARNMHSDGELAGQILIMTTILSCFTLFIGTFILRQFGLF